MERSAYLLAVACLTAWLAMTALWLRWPPLDTRAAQSATGQKIDINAATAGQLCLLPGVGPTTAQHIIELRREHGGRFDRVENLLATPRLSGAAFEKMRGMIVCGPAAPPAPEWP